MDESSEGSSDEAATAPEATDEDVEAAISGVVGPQESEATGESASDSPSESPAEKAPGEDPDPDELPQGIHNAPASAEDGSHTLLEEYERENEPRWKTLARQGAFWAGATAVAVAVTLTAVVSLRQSGLSDGVAFILASVGMALMVGFVFLSLRR